MNRRLIFGALLAILCAFGMPAAGITQPQPAPPLNPAAQGHYIPITLVLSLDAVGAKALQELQTAPQPPAVAPQPGVVPDKVQQPVPFPPPGTVQIFGGKKKGGLLDKIREKKPLQKLLAALADKQDIIKELEKITQPVNVGNDLWLSINLREIVFVGVDISGIKDVTVHLAARLEPVLVLSKERPAPMPLPQFAFGKELPPPLPGGTPIDIVLKIDPKALPSILPAETTEQLTKYGIDSAGITFAQQAGPKGSKLVVGVPLQKPTPANLSLWFTPRVANNVLTFAEPDAVMTFPKSDQADNPVQLTLQKLTGETVRSLAVGKLKNTEVDFTPHIKKMANLPLGQPTAGAPPKIQAPISNLRVEELSAENNHLVLRITGVVAKTGIVVVAP